MEEKESDTAVSEPTESESVLAIKRAVRERDGYRCVKCGMTNDQHVARYGSILDVHRVVPGSPYQVAGSETVCRECHGKEPKRPKGSVKQQYNVRLDPVGLALAETLPAAIGGKIGMPITQADLVRMALVALAEKFGILVPAPAPVVSPIPRPAPRKRGCKTRKQQGA